MGDQRSTSTVVPAFRTDNREEWQRTSLSNAI
jgi:hypothetical protein